MEATSPAGSDRPQPHAQGAAGESASLLLRIKGKLFTWNILKIIALGQMLSLCICGTAITSQYLAERYKVNTPMLQSFINYCLLFLIYTVILAFQSGSDNLLNILKKKWWKYILLGLADVEANYLIVRAYQYTTLTSVQLLDCFGIPVLMALSWFILYARYRVIHFIAVAVCLLGVGTMVGADILAGREDNSGSDVLIGDILVLLGASLYAVSNVCEEYIVKKLSRQEFLGMVGLFGTIISGIQLLIVEYKDIASIHWDWKIALLFVAFALCMFCLYSFMPLVIKVTSATSVNLGILTADLYSLFFGLFLFGYKTTLGPAQSPGVQTAWETSRSWSPRWREREEKPTAAQCVLDPVQEVRTSRRSFVCTLKSAFSSHQAALRMERSTRELCLNFTVVLITVILIWLLVRSYQY